jgi:threonine dehydrogenase-like Zn-dependent dehydrogenase
MRVSTARLSLQPYKTQQYLRQPHLRSSLGLFRRTMSIEAVSKDALTPTSRSGSVDRAVQGQLDIAVIGAGLVGLATSAMLRKQGHRLTVRPLSTILVS